MARLEMRLGKSLPGLGALAAFALVLAVLLLPHASMFPGGAYTDIGVAHLPQILYLRRALSRWHVLPLWSPTYYSGYPFYADPLAEIWYPPAWLVVLLPLPWGLWLAFGLHLFVSAVGMFALLRRWGRSGSAALFGALAWMLFPKIWAHWGAGHLSLLFAISWTPWLLLAFEAQRPLFPPALVWALIFLADPRWAAYAAFLWLLWAVKRWRESRARGRRPLALLEAGQKAARSWPQLLVALLAAPLAIPLWRYSHLSTRAFLTPDDVLRFSLAPWRLVGLVFPAAGWFHEWIIYVGIAPFLLAAFAWMRGRARFWLGIASAASLWSLGKYLPGLSLLAGLPLVNLLRVPPRAMFLCGFAVAVASAFGLDLLFAQAGNALSRKERLGLFGLVVLGGMLSASMLALGGMGRYAVLALLLWLGAFLLFGAHLPQRWRTAVWVGVLLADLMAMDAHFLYATTRSQIFEVPHALAEAVAKVPRPFRLYSPSYSIPQQVAASRGWELANGVDPLVLKSYAEFMALASGVPEEGYSVVIPPMKDGYRMADAKYVPNAARLGLLNVRLVVAHFPIRADGLKLGAYDGEVWVYKNLRAMPRVWVEPTPRAALSWPEAVRPARLDCWCPNRVRATAVGPGRLVFSEVNYPGWRAFVDGKPVALRTAYDVLRAVSLPPGAHTVELRFWPLDLILGLLLAAVGLLAWLGRAFWR